MPGRYGRGNIWDVELDPVVGSETGKRRPCLIIQNDLGNKYAPTVIIAAITDAENVKRPYPVDVAVEKGKGGLEKKSVVQCSQIRTVDKKRLLKHRGKLPPKKMEEVDEALRISLSLASYL
jgi:mRNA interferase MazF